MEPRIARLDDVDIYTPVDSFVREAPPKIAGLMADPFERPYVRRACIPAAGGNSAVCVRRMEPLMPRYSQATDREYDHVPQNAIFALDGASRNGSDARYPGRLLPYGRLCGDMMDEADLSAFREGIRDFLAEECALNRVQAHAKLSAGLNQPLWDQIVAMGWPMIAIPEAQGGMGLDLPALAAAYEELGRSIAPLPFLSTMLAVQAIKAGASEALQAEWLKRIAAGAIFATAPRSTASNLRVVRDSDAVMLTGSISHLLDAPDADCLLLAATDDNNRSVRIVVEPVADGVTVETLSIWDRTRSMGSLRFDGQRFPMERLFVLSDEDEEKLLSHAAIGLAADAVGGADALLDLTVEYLKTRHQFGQPIGSFQALKHRAADHRTRLEADRAFLRTAIAAYIVGGDAAHSDASAIKALACTDYVEFSRDAIQLHGGIGFTAEYGAHLFKKRAWIDEAAFDGREAHVDRAIKFAFPEEAA